MDDKMKALKALLDEIRTVYNTYVGARYVPNFIDDPWNDTTQYEAMDVVDNGMGTSYIAKKPVPVGTPLNDREYWFVYGSTSGAIINLQNQIDAIVNTTIPGINSEIEALTDERGDIVTENVTLDPNDNISDKQIYSNTDATISTQNVSIDGDSSLENVNIFGLVNPAARIDDNVSIEHCRTNTDNGISIGIDIDGQNVNGVKIAHNRVEAENYPILVNDASGKDLLIDGNSVISRNSDGIEINDPAGSLTGVRIVNNHVTCNPAGSGDCLGLGIAKGQTLIASGNIIESAKMDGLHIEADSTDIIVNNNIFNDCKRYGAQIGNSYRISGIDATHKINNNIFRSKTNGACGIFLSYSSDSSVNSIDISNNIVDGFALGANLQALRDEHKSIIVDNLIIKNCADGAIVGRNLIGKLIFDNVPGYLIATQANVDVEIDEVVSITPIDPDNLLYSGATAPTIIKRIKYPVQVTATTGVNLTKNVMKLGAYAKGEMLITFSNPNTGDKVRHLLNIDTVSGTPIQSQPIYSYGSIGVSYSISGGYLVASSTVHPTGTLEFNLDFRGIYEV